jgi:hypothetical protein
MSGVLVGVIVTTWGDVTSLRFVSDVAGATVRVELEPRGEGVSRNEPDMESMVSSLTDDLLLFSVIGSTPASCGRFDKSVSEIKL